MCFHTTDTQPIPDPLACCFPVHLSVYQLAQWHRVMRRCRGVDCSDAASCSFQFMTHETEPRDQGAVLRRGDALSERKMMEYPGDTCFKDTPRAPRYRTRLSAHHVAAAAPSLCLCCAFITAVTVSIYLCFLKPGYRRYGSLTHCPQRETR